MDRAKEGADGSHAADWGSKSNSPPCHCKGRSDKDGATSSVEMKEKGWAWPLGLIGTMGAILTWASWKWDSTAFEELFYGGLFAGHVRLGQFMFLLLLVMVALVVISRTEDLDEAV